MHNLCPCNNSINIRILIEHDSYVQSKNICEEASCMSVHPLDESVQTKVTTFLIDNELLFIVELKDVTKENSNEAIG
jgi:hypothetical protein